MKIKLIALLTFIIIFQTLADENIYKTNNASNWRNNSIFSSTIDFDNINHSLINAAVFFRTNEMRIANKLPPLEYSINLEKSATIHSDDMVQRNFFSHINPGNLSRRNPDDRARLAGITNPYIAENIANNFAIKYTANTRVIVSDSDKGIFKYPGENDPIPNHTFISFAEALVEQWMNSAGHRENILNKEALELGVGTTFYRDRRFNNIPKFMAVQNFQFFEKIKR